MTKEYIGIPAFEFPAPMDLLYKSPEERRQAFELFSLIPGDEPVVRNNLQMWVLPDDGRIGLLNINTTPVKTDKVTFKINPEEPIGPTTLSDGIVLYPGVPVTIEIGTDSLVVVDHDYYGNRCYEIVRDEEE